MIALPEMISKSPKIGRSIIYTKNTDVIFD